MLELGASQIPFVVCALACWPIVITNANNKYLVIVSIFIMFKFKPREDVSGSFKDGIHKISIIVNINFFR